MIRRKKLKFYFTIAVIPFSLLILNLLFVKDIGDTYLSCFDPAYNYLLNGLNLALGKIEIGDPYHPGTPVQLLSALIIRIVHFFYNDLPLMESVLSNPEIYLLSMVYTLIAINIYAFFLLGKSVYNQTGSLNKAIFLQLTPLVSLVSVLNIRNVGCESPLLVLSVFLVLLSFKYTFSQNEQKQGRYIIFYSILASVIVTIKVSAFPLLILPVILLNGKINKFKYIGLTAILVSIILIPIYNKLSVFAGFILDIFTHLGSYGQGKESFFDFTEYFGNMHKMFSSESPFTIFYFIIFISSILCAFKHKWFVNAIYAQKKLLWAISFVLTLQILIVARQFSFHYMLPAYSLEILGVYQVLQIISPNIKFAEKIKKKHLTISLFVVVILLIIRIVIYYNFFPGLINPEYRTVEFIKTHNNMARVILAERYKETAFPEQAFYFGTSYSGEMKNQYRRFLEKKYPKTWFYDKNEALYNWDSHFMKEDLMMKYPEILLYIKYVSDNQRDAFISQYLKLKVPDSMYICSPIFTNKTSHEIIYLLKCDTNIIRNAIKPGLSINCNLDSISIDTTKFSDASGSYNFDKAYLRTNKKYRSEPYSLKLCPESPYGADIQLKALPGNFFRIRVWRCPQGNGGIIVASSKNPDEFFIAGESLIQKGQYGWELVELAFYIPQYYPNENINLYLWNNSKNDIYFDDLNVKVYP
jgi:hypothetical protein